MAKRKKEQQTLVVEDITSTTELAQRQNDKTMAGQNQEHAMVQSGAINYKGNVRITIRHGEQLIKTVTYHNSGGIALFNFLKFALDTTDFTALENRRPKKLVVLLANTSYTRELPDDNMWEG